MAGIFKAYAGMPRSSGGSNGTVVIDNTVVVKEQIPAIADNPDAAFAANEADANANTAKAQQEAIMRERMDEEIERVRNFYKQEGEKALAEAKEKAQNILRLTEKEAEEYAQQAKAQAEEIFAKAKEDGFAEGKDEGYKKGLMKCKDMLLELKEASEKMVADRAELYDIYETEIFDTVMEIANRVTMNSLNQKDKAVVRKIVKEAGKSFRGSEYVKISIAGTDVCEELPADAEYFKKLLNGVKTVEVEVLKEAQSGTVIIDNGSEITDAGVMTQLKMIEELGKGKYRRAPSKRKKKEEAEAEQPSDEVADTSQEEAVEQAAEE